MHFLPITLRAHRIVSAVVVMSLALLVGGCGTDAPADLERQTLASTVVDTGSDAYQLIATQTDQAEQWQFTVEPGSQSSPPATDRPLEFEWDFGDGKRVRGPSRIHSFPEPGLHLVTVHALDGEQIVFTLEVEIETAPADNPSPSDATGPVARAGQDQQTVENVLVFLDGSDSFDPQGGELGFTWTQSFGPTVFLENADTAVASFVAPSTGQDVHLEFTLEVSNGSQNATDQVGVDVFANGLPDSTLVPACSFSLLPEDGSTVSGDITGPGPLTVIATASTVDGTQLPAGTLSWSVDGVADSGAVENQAVKTFSFTSGGVHTLALALTVGGVTTACQSGRTGLTAEQMIVRPSISGLVQDSSGTGLAGIAVSANAGGTTGVTDQSGSFSVNVPFDWSGVVTPQHIAYGFTPPSQSFSSVKDDIISQLFVASPQSVGCASDSQCDDGLFCNGVERCSGGGCVGGSLPCPGQPCDETTDSCSGCLTDSDCNDGNPCTDDTCDAGGNCVNASNDANSCDDGLFCTGTESCTSGSCVSSGDPCPGQTCVEASDTCANGQSLTGTINDYSGSPAVGVNVVLSGTGSSAGTDFTVTTDSAGSYQQVVPDGWSGTATSDTDYRFEPVSLSFSNVTSSVTGADFKAFRNYYVDHPGDSIGLDGSDSSAGTFAAPFATIQHAASLVNPGDTVFIKAGTYDEWVKVTRSGTATDQITFRNYQNDVVTIDGESIRTGCFTVGFPDNYTSGHFITVDGLRMTGTQNGTTGGSGACAIMYHSQNSIFRNLTVFHCGFGTPIINGALSTGIALRGANQNCTVEFCDVYDNYRGGITVGSAGGGTPGSPRNITVDNCYVHNNENGDDEDSDGIWISADVNGDSGIVVTNCIVHNNADDGIDVPSSNGVLIANNIAFEQGRNTATGDGNGIKVSTSVGGTANGGGNHIVRHNFVFSNARGGIDQDISPTAQHNFFYNNTIYGNDNHGLILDVGGGSNLDTAAVVLNNIMANNNVVAGSFLDYRAGSGGCGGSQTQVILDSNFNIIGDGCKHPAEGAGTLTGDPMLVNPGAAIDTTPQGSLQATMDFIRAQVKANFAPKPGSPALDAGIDLNLGFSAVDDAATVNTGSAGTGTLNYFDIGAVEGGLP